MDKKEIQFFRDLLNRQLDELLEQADSTISSLRQVDSVEADPLDRASQEAISSELLRFRERESRLIKKIRSALERIEEEDFGICDGCGEEIALARLKARPVATLCIECKTRMEEIEKLYI